MSQNQLRPTYHSKPIGSVTALARALKQAEAELRALASDANNLYRLAKPIIKADGSIRQPFDAKGPLKSLHARVKDQIFAKVGFPPYLTGSVRGRDYVTNAKLHVNKRIVICEDIQSFFPSVRAALVYDVWRGLFNFHPDVAELLTLLTTKDGVLPQGAITSSYLANLVLFRWEPTFCERLAGQGVAYSRYVDDVAMSSAVFLSTERQTEILAGLHGMLGKAGLKAKRKKHETLTSGGQMRTTKLVVNKRVALTQQQRDSVRAAVFQVERLAKGGLTSDVAVLLSRAAARVGHLKRFHPSEAQDLADRLAALRERCLREGVLTGVASTHAISVACGHELPWQ